MSWKLSTQVSKEDYMKKFFVIDTNVLIHNPMSIYSFADNTVVVPIKVIEELDNLKNSVDKKGMHARQVLREIDHHIKKGALKTGARMANGGTLVISLGTNVSELPRLDEDVADNKILSVAWDLQQKGESVFFISKDVNARIKAEALGIRSADYEKEKVEYSALYKGWKAVPLLKKDVQRLKDEGELAVKGVSFYDNEYALVHAQKDLSYSVLARFEPQESMLRRVSESCNVMGISPLNMEQRIALDLLLNDEIKLVTLVGQAGTGKTLLAVASALAKILARNPTYEKLLIVRPIVPLGKDIGYLPGSKEKKLNYWMQPIYDNLDFILKQSAFAENKDWSTSDLTVDGLQRSEFIEIEAVTYIRGRSIPNQFFIVDEAQNLTPHEIKTIISRAGEGTKIVLTGDPDQIDNPYLDANSNGLSYAVERLKKFNLFGHVLLSQSERSELASLAVEEL
jgi:PhoH-like ATPase